MSKELADVLNCMSLKLPENFKGQISTISDAEYIGNLKACDDEDCEENEKKCTHPCQSCHYGGGTGSGVSYAVNFSDKANLKIYEKAIDYCDKNYYIKAHPIDNPTHVHLSIGKCPVN